jgi:glutaredoxin 3
MKIEFYHLQGCLFSSKVRHFISDKKLNGFIEYHDVQNTNNARKLLDLTGDEQVPCLVVDGNPILESDDIIKWLDENLTKRAA